VRQVHCQVTGGLVKRTVNVSGFVLSLTKLLTMYSLDDKCGSLNGRLEPSGM